MSQYYYPSNKNLAELFVKKHDSDAIKQILETLQTAAKNRTIAFPKRTAHASGTLASQIQGKSYVILENQEFERLCKESAEIRHAAWLAREAKKLGSTRTAATPADKNKPIYETAVVVVDDTPAHPGKSAGRNARKQHERRDEGGRYRETKGRKKDYQSSRFANENDW